jgi:hypothetical protein
MNINQREILDNAYEIIRDMVNCDCGCEPVMHKGNCTLISRAMWMAHYALSRDDIARSRNGSAM